MKDQPEKAPGYYSDADCRPEDLEALTSQVTTSGHAPHAVDICHNIPVYDAADITSDLSDPARRAELMAEWARLLLSGPGVVALRGAVRDTDALDTATGVFEDIIAGEKSAGGEGADHFAASGANDRIWNALQKLCLRDPDAFMRSFASPCIDAVCEAWLGPGYQMTAQVNLVHPGGAAQQAHRDYHLGFQTSQASASFPAHVHALSPALTLQGAVAHTDMPVESGPTKLLPYSQAYLPGYAAWRRDDFRAFFEENCVQLPLTKGDAIFFSPALFHAAGANTTTDIHRLANLLQVSSPFGRAMETVDRTAMCKALYPVALAARQAGTLSDAELTSVVAAVAEGYAFPTNLDSDPPTGGLAPQTQQAYFREALEKGVVPDEFDAHLDRMDARRRA
ncbi:phytanoyl-CoA dioxygenase family protein [uncultured Roseobacter sp.]|uniref:phytanoyl-CoA dioxygenase family protein n=1 Tax=uncultured Roseobacter sp. TaxID=114847 RepID=UPI002633F6C4|nr:phytanoyl-CoA dioxygenase family protein [uncultured Roseobacter sp.]